VAASKLKALGMVNTGETIPNPFDFAQGSAAIEAATLQTYLIEVDKLPGMPGGGNGRNSEHLILVKIITAVRV